MAALIFVQLSTKKLFILSLSTWTKGGAMSRPFATFIATEIMGFRSAVSRAGACVSCVKSGGGDVKRLAW